MGLDKLTLTFVLKTMVLKLAKTFAKKVKEEKG